MEEYTNDTQLWTVAGVFMENINVDMYEHKVTEIEENIELVNSVYVFNNDNDWPLWNIDMILHLSDIIYIYIYIFCIFNYITIC